MESDKGENTRSLDMRVKKLMNCPLSPFVAEELSRIVFLYGRKKNYGKMKSIVKYLINIAFNMKDEEYTLPTLKAMAYYMHYAREEDEFARELLLVFLRLHEIHHFNGRIARWSLGFISLAIEYFTRCLCEECIDSTKAILFSILSRVERRNSSDARDYLLAGYGISQLVNFYYFMNRKEEVCQYMDFLSKIHLLVMSCENHNSYEIMLHFIRENHHKMTQKEREVFFEMINRTWLREKFKMQNASALNLLLKELLSLETFSEFHDKISFMQKQIQCYSPQEYRITLTSSPEEQILLNIGFYFIELVMYIISIKLERESVSASL